jgi:hypothetical protein
MKKSPEVEVREGGREITIYQNDRAYTTIHVTLGKRSGWKVTVDRTKLAPTGKSGKIRRVPDGGRRVIEGG